MAGIAHRRAVSAALISLVGLHLVAGPVQAADNWDPGQIEVLARLYVEGPAGQAAGKALGDFAAKSAAYAPDSALFSKGAQMAVRTPYGWVKVGATGALMGAAIAGALAAWWETRGNPDRDKFPGPPVAGGVGFVGLYNGGAGGKYSCTVKANPGMIGFWSLRNSAMSDPPVVTGINITSDPYFNSWLADGSAKREYTFVTPSKGFFVDRKTQGGYREGYTLYNAPSAAYNKPFPPSDPRWQPAMTEAANPGVGDKLITPVRYGSYNGPGSSPSGSGQWGPDAGATGVPTLYPRVGTDGSAPGDWTVSPNGAPPPGDPGTPPGQPKPSPVPTVAPSKPPSPLPSPSSSPEPTPEPTPTPEPVPSLRIVAWAPQYVTLEWTGGPFKPLPGDDSPPNMVKFYVDGAGPVAGEAAAPTGRVTITHDFTRPRRVAMRPYSTISKQTGDDVATIDISPNATPQPSPSASSVPSPSPSPSGTPSPEPSSPDLPLPDWRDTIFWEHFYNKASKVFPFDWFDLSGVREMPTNALEVEFFGIKHSLEFTRPIWYGMEAIIVIGAVIGLFALL